MNKRNQFLRRFIIVTAGLLLGASLLFLIESQHPPAPASAHWLQHGDRHGPAVMDKQS